MGLKSKLEAEYLYDFDLLGLVSPAKDYVLAWHFNDVSFLHFVKGEDIQIDFRDNSRILISNFVFESEFVHVLLLRNKLLVGNPQMNKYLVPELQQFDYLIQFKSEVDDPSANHLLDIAKSVPLVHYAVKLDIEKIKNKENLLF
ncbi:MAG: IPExxxVDY family protein [Bacteroidota bacterium]